MEFKINLIEILIALFIVFLIGYAVGINENKETEELPAWAYGLECHICEKTFISPQAHYDEVTGQGFETLKEHEHKIPKLR